MFESIRAGVIRSDVATARKNNHLLVRLIKRGWGKGLLADDARAARDSALKNARRVRAGSKK